MYRFFLNFKNDSTGRVEISEPVKFDSANFVIEQDKKRYGRDVFYGNEEVSLEFYKGIYENGLAHEFERLIQYYYDFGFESEVEFIVQLDNVDFVVGILDFELAETDQIEYFKTKVIQNTKQAIVKRRDDINIDVFSNVDLDENPITPVTTQKILLKAKPFVQYSKFKENNTEALSTSLTGNRFNTISLNTTNWGASNINIVEKYGIEDTLSFIENRNVLNSFYFPISENFTLIEAKEDLTNVIINIKDLIAYTYQFKNDFFSNIVTSGSGFSKLVLKYGYNIDGSGSDLTEVVLYSKFFGFVDNTPIEYLPQNYSHTIPILRSGMRLYFYFYCDSEATFNQYGDSGSLAKYEINAIIEKGNIEITATSTAVDSVIDGVRHIDYVKQVVKSATGLPVIAPKYDVGGLHYDNFVFNGKLIRQFTDQSFYGTIKENMDQLQELNSDYQINQDNIYIGQYNDFYTTNEIGAFLTAPDDSFKSQFNERYTLLGIDYKYKSFEQDRDEKNTIDAVHTSTQWLTSNKQTESILKIEVPFVRDPFEIESARRQGINTKDTTSLSNDDKVYILDVVPLPPNSRRNFTRVLQYQTIQADNTLKILSDGGFNWTLLGFGVGDVISVTLQTTRQYTVTEIESSLITLVPTSGTITADVQDTQVITVDYPLTQVLFTNRINEGFTLIENIASGDNFSNLRYTIKRNMKYFYPYFKTACKYISSGKIRNTYFKSNKDATTQYLGGEIITEGADILVSELDNAILSPFKYNTTLVSDFQDVHETLVKMQTINPDNSIGGFIRMMDNNFRVMKIYPTKLDYSWATAELKCEGEELQESEFLQVNKVGNLIYINEVGYAQDIIYPITLRTEGDYVQIMDKRGVGLHNKINFNKVQVNSNIFSNIVELSETLLTL